MDILYKYFMLTFYVCHYYYSIKHSIFSKFNDAQNMSFVIFHIKGQYSISNVFNTVITVFTCLNTDGEYGGGGL